MASVLIIAKNQADLEAIKKLAEEKGLAIIVVDEKAPKKLTVEELIKLAERSSGSHDESAETSITVEEPIAAYNTNIKSLGMEKIIIGPTNDRQVQMLKIIIGRLGIPFSIPSEKEKKYLAALKMTSIAEQHPKHDLSDEEIIRMLQESEEVIYGKNKPDH